MINKEPTIYKQGLQFPNENGTFIAKNGEWVNTDAGELIEIKDNLQGIITDNRNFVQFFCLHNLPLVYCYYWLRMKNSPQYSDTLIIDVDNMPISRVTTGFWQQSWSPNIDGTTTQSGFLSLRGSLFVQTRDMAFVDKIITGSAIFLAKKKES